jgi:hypothetical protein
MPRFFTVAPFEHVMARAELCQAPSSIDSLKARVSTPDKWRTRKSDEPGTATWEVSYQCHMNYDEWRQKVNKDRKEKVNLTTPI